MYLYIFEDGEIAQSDTKPTNVDLAMIDEGTLRVFTMQRGVFLGLSYDEARHPSLVPMAGVDLDAAGDQYHYATQG